MKPPNKNNEINLLLYGSCYEVLSRESTKLPEIFLPWVLCERYRPFLRREFGLDPSGVGVIPRRVFLDAELIPLKKPDSFVFAGRPLIPSKRLRLAVELIEKIRHLSGLDYRFHVAVAGSFDRHLFNDLFPKKSYPWIELHLGLKSDWYCSFPSSTLISLSTYSYEDLGVAPCEALNAGLRCVLSDWGGYSDFDHPRVLKLKPPIEDREISNARFCKISAQSVLNFLNTDVDDKKWQSPSAQISSPKPVALSPFMTAVRPDEPRRALELSKSQRLSFGPL